LTRDSDILLLVKIPPLREEKNTQKPAVLELKKGKRRDETITPGREKGGILNPILVLSKGGRIGG